MEEKAKKARREYMRSYMRKYRRKYPDKTREANDQYWTRRAEKEAENHGKEKSM